MVFKMFKNTHTYVLILKSSRVYNHSHGIICEEVLTAAVVVVPVQKGGQAK
jgi:hypothetical protein